MLVCAIVFISEQNPFFVDDHMPLSLMCVRAKCMIVGSRLMRVSQVALVVKNLSASAEDVRNMGSIPGTGRSLEREMAIASSVLAWKIPWTEEPGGLQSIVLQRIGQD